MTLYPCPFCGSDDIKAAKHYNDSDGDGYTSWSVACNECGATVTALTQADVRQAWNRRAHSTPIATEAKRRIRAKFDEAERTRTSDTESVGHVVTSERMWAYGRAMKMIDDAARDVTSHEPTPTTP